MVDDEPTTPLPSSFPVASAAPAPRPVQQAPAAPAAARRRPFSMEEMNALPRLSAGDRAKHGIGEMRLNVLREASPTQPEALAIINLKKVYVGEIIPGTRARLIGVQSRAIAIEIEDTGERFRVM